MKTFEGFNTIIGTQIIGCRYKFTDDTSLCEAAKGIYEMGSDVLKFTLNNEGYFDIKDKVKRENRENEFRTYKGKANSKEFKEVLSLDFKYYMMWVQPKFGNKDGVIDLYIDDEIEKKIYDEIYELTEYLLKEYNDTGKTFLIGNWEGDWILLKGYDYLKNPDEYEVQGLIKNLRIRQKAVEDARRNTCHTNVWVGHYVEVNRPLDAKDFGYKRVTNSILPNIKVDMVSYSAYDSTFPVRTTEALEYIENNSNFTSYFDNMFTKKVFIGEYDCFNDYHVNGYVNEEKQVINIITTINSAIAWGSPFVLYWEYYNNEYERLKKGHGFWLIDNENKKHETYYTHKRLLERLNYITLIYRYFLNKNPNQYIVKRIALVIHKYSNSGLLKYILSVLDENEKNEMIANFRKVLGTNKANVRNVYDDIILSLEENEISREEFSKYCGYSTKILPSSYSKYDIWENYIDSQEFSTTLLKGRKDILSDKELMRKIIFPWI